MRWSRALAAPLMILLVTVACSSPAASEGGNGNGGNGSEESQAGEPTAEATPDNGGNGGNGGGNTGDAESAFERLTPPSSSEVTKTTASGIVFGAFTSTDSVDSLTSFYMTAFDDLGLQVLTTTETSGGVSWFVGTDENASEFGGVVSVIPDPNGNGSQVSIQIGKTN